MKKLILIAALGLFFVSCSRIYDNNPRPKLDTPTEWNIEKGFEGTLDVDREEKSFFINDSVFGNVFEGGLNPEMDGLHVNDIEFIYVQWKGIFKFILDGYVLKDGEKTYILANSETKVYVTR